ncbi:MAG: dihydrodipicolinate synthase family protein [Erysipelotrichaceae bacterium]|nr:dihydrodipicolinate synthase family protein [Erysipelotrichaceae bacterium]
MGKMIKGIIPALVTAFDRQGQIDIEKAKRLIDYTIDGGVSGIFILGTNGEFYTIEEGEGVEYARQVIEYVGERVPVYVGLGSNSTAQTIRYGKRMIREAGAKCFTVITPFFQALSQAELIGYYRDVADALKTPILMYNIPARTNINIDPASVGILADNPYIVGIKDSSGNLDNLKGYLEQTSGKDFKVLCGSDSKILTALQLGAVGAVASTSNLIPRTICGIYDSFIAGDLEKARYYQEDLEVLRLTMKLAGVPAVLKKALNLMGINVGDPRLPVRAVSDEQVTEKIREMLRHYGLTE